MAGILEEGPIRKLLREKGRVFSAPGQERVVGGLYIVVRGHPPAGEKIELVWYGFNEKAAVAQAKVHKAYVYQLLYSFR